MYSDYAPFSPHGSNRVSRWHLGPSSISSVAGHTTVHAVHGGHHARLDPVDRRVDAATILKGHKSDENLPDKWPMGRFPSGRQLQVCISFSRTHFVFFGRSLRWIW